MVETLKALVVVLGLGSTVWFCAKPLFKPYIDPKDYVLRRNSWLLLTPIAFLSPSFWLYVFIVLFVVARAIKRDTNPIAHYVALLYVAPPVMVPIPMIGIGSLFDLNNIRLLGLALLLPLLFLSNRRFGANSQPKAIRFLDALVISFCALRIILWDYESVTNLLRVSLILFVDIALPYFAFSRLISDRKQFKDTIATFCLMCLVLVPIALFEFARGWSLYQVITDQWTGFPGIYLVRAGVLRALASTFHPLALGYLFAIALVFSFYLFPPKTTGRVAKLVPTFIAVGLIAPYSRGPWIAAAIGAIFFRLLSPKPIAGLLKASLATGLALCLLLLTPYADRIIQSLPFVGTIEASTVEYRVQLIHTALEFFLQNPWFGDQYVVDRMARLDHMISGGIVDLVNGYVLTALHYGLVTLLILVSILAHGYRLGAKGFHASKRRSDTDGRQLGAALIAAWLSSAVYLGTAGFEHLMWVLLGMLATYSRDDFFSNNDALQKAIKNGKRYAKRQ